MARICSHCSGKSLELVGSESITPTPTVFLAVGGYLFALSYSLSRKLIYRCKGCAKETRARSLFRWLMQVIYLLHLTIIICLAVIAALFVIAAVSFLLFS